MTLLDAKEYDSEKARKKKTRIISAIAILIVVLSIVWLFRYLPQERIVGHFFAALQKQDYKTAYGIWMHDPNWAQHPEKRHLPSLSEWARLCRLTDRALWTAVQQQMMDATRRLYACRLGTVGCVLIALAVGARKFASGWNATLVGLYRGVTGFFGSLASGRGSYLPDSFGGPFDHTAKAQGAEEVGLTSSRRLGSQRAHARDLLLSSVA